MEIIGKIIAKLPLQSGTSKAGNEWHKQEYVLETNESDPKKVHFDFFGAKADEFAWVEIGKTIKLSFDIESREYQGRWYTSIRGWKAEEADATAPAGAPAPAPAPVAGAPVPPAPAAPTPPYDTNFGGGDNSQLEDLPF